MKENNAADECDLSAPDPRILSSKLAFQKTSIVNVRMTERHHAMFVPATVAKPSCRDARGEEWDHRNGANRHSWPLATRQMAGNHQANSSQLLSGPLMALVHYDQGGDGKARYLPKPDVSTMREAQEP